MSLISFDRLSTGQINGEVFDSTQVSVYQGLDTGYAKGILVGYDEDSREVTVQVTKRKTIRAHVADTFLPVID